MSCFMLRDLTENKPEFITFRRFFFMAKPEDVEHVVLEWQNSFHAYAEVTT